MEKIKQQISDNDIILALFLSVALMLLILGLASYLVGTWAVVVCFIVFIVMTIVQIDENTYGLSEIFGKLGRAVKPGLRLRIPFFESFIIFSSRLETHNFVGDDVVIVTSSDGLTITIEGSVQERPDFKKLAKNYNVTTGTIKTGMKDAVQGGLRIVAGREKGDDFIRYGEEVAYVINTLFRLGRRVDFYVDKKDPEIGFGDSEAWGDYITRLEEAIDDPANGKTEKEKEELHRKADRLKDPAEWSFPTIMYKFRDDDPEEKKEKILDVLNFYRKNITHIDNMLLFEDIMQESSPLEDLYGNDITTFKVAEVRFTDKVQDAREQRKIAEKELEAQERRKEMMLEVTNELIEKGLSPEDAAQLAAATVGIAPMQTIKGAVLPIVNLK